MTLRTSKAPAACLVPAEPGVLLLMTALLSAGDHSAEDDVEHDDHDQRDAGQLGRRLVPGQPVRVRVGALLPRRLGVDQPGELGDRLGRGHLADRDAHHDVDDERGARGPEARAPAAAGPRATGRPAARPTPAPTTTAALAARRLAPWPPMGSTPRDAVPNASWLRRATRTAASVTGTRPIHPADAPASPPTPPPPM